MSTRIVVLGGGYAGLTAAARIGESGRAGTLTLVDAKPAFTERIRLHEIAAGSTPRDLSYAAFMEARGGAFLQGRVTALDAGERRLSVRLSDGGEESLEYDRLVYAPGSATDRWTVPGVDSHAICLDSLEECGALFDRLSADRAVLIVGGGLTAIEAACEIAERIPGLRITLAAGRDFGPSPDPGGLSPAGFAHVAATLERLGVRVADEARVARLEADRAILDDGRDVAFDECIWAAGFRVPALAREAGLSVNAAGQVVTDETLRSVSHPEIVAVGDAAEVVATPGGRCRMSCAAGRPMGERAAATAIASPGDTAADPFEFSYRFRCISLGREDGLIQFVDPEDRPRNDVWTGARAARWKEYICRRTLAGVGFDTDLGPPPDTPPQFS